MRGRARRLAQPRTSSVSTTSPNGSSPTPCGRCRRRRPTRRNGGSWCSPRRSLGVATVRDLASYYVIKPKVAKRESRGARRGRRAGRGDASTGWRETGYAVPSASAEASDPRARHAAVAVRLAHLGSQPRAAPLRLRLPHRGLRPRARAQVRLLRAPAAPRRPARCAASISRPTARRRCSRFAVPTSSPVPTPNAVAAAAATELDALRDWLQLDGVVVARRGNLATAVRRALA